MKAFALSLKPNLHTIRSSMVCVQGHIRLLVCRILMRELLVEMQVYPLIECFFKGYWWNGFVKSAGSAWRFMVRSR